MATQKIGLLLVAVGLGLRGLMAQSLVRAHAFGEAQRLTQRAAWDSALAAWKGLLLRERDSASVALIYQQLGYIALHRGDSTEALQLWETALRFRPEYPIALQNYQWLRQRLHQPPPPTPPNLQQYIPPPPISEKAPPTLGEKNRYPQPNQPQWLPAARLHP